MDSRHQQIYAPREEIRQLAEHMAAIDPLAFEAFIAIAGAMVAGCDDETALAIGNDVLIKAGHEPLPVPDLAVKGDESNANSNRA